MSNKKINERYFLVKYREKNELQAFHHSIIIEKSNGRFPSLIEIENESNTNNIVIENIFEFKCKSDYLDYIGENDEN